MRDHLPITTPVVDEEEPARRLADDGESESLTNFFSGSISSEAFDKFNNRVEKKVAKRLNKIASGNKDKKNNKLAEKSIIQFFKSLKYFKDVSVTANYEAEGHLMRFFSKKAGKAKKDIFRKILGSDSSVVA